MHGPPIMAALKLLININGSLNILHFITFVITAKTGNNTQPYCCWLETMMIESSHTIVWNSLPQCRKYMDHGKLRTTHYSYWSTPNLDMGRENRPQKSWVNFRINDRVEWSFKFSWFNNQSEKCSINIHRTGAIKSCRRVTALCNHVLLTMIGHSSPFRQLTDFANDISRSQSYCAPWYVSSSDVSSSRAVARRFAESGPSKNAAVANCTGRKCRASLQEQYCISKKSPVSRVVLCIGLAEKPVFKFEVTEDLVWFWHTSVQQWQFRLESIQFGLSILYNEPIKDSGVYNYETYNTSWCYIRSRFRLTKLRTPTALSLRTPELHGFRMRNN